MNPTGDVDNIILVCFVWVFLLAFVVESLRTRRATTTFPFLLQFVVRFECASMCSFHAFYSSADPVQRHCLLYVVHAVLSCVSTYCLHYCISFCAREEKKNNSRFDTITRAQFAYKQHLACRLKRTDTMNWNGKQLRHFSSRYSKRRPRYE